MVERGQHSGNVRAGERRSALGGGKIAAKGVLNFLEGSAETHDVFLGHRGEHLHDDEPAEPGGIVFREWRQLPERIYLLGAVDSATRRIEQQNDSPAIRKRKAADDWRRCLCLRAPAVDHQSAMMKQPDADARTRTAAEVERIARNIERQAVQA